MKRILFYSSVKSLELFKAQKFYQIDIDILKQLGYEVSLSNRIFDAFKFWKYDIVFSYFYRYSFFPSLMARMLGKKIFFTGGIDDLDENYASPKRYRIQKLFFKLCYMTANSCIVVSCSDLNNILKLNFGTNKLSFSEHAINTELFETNQHKDCLFSTIVWQGEEGNVRRKGVDKALQIFSKLKTLPSFADYKFVIMGRKGAATPFVESLISKYGLGDSVILTGEVSEDDKVDILKKSRYYFQLSKYEGFGLAALEALCSGCVLIHSGKGGLSNPLYSDQILFDIDNDFEAEYDKLYIIIENGASSSLK